MSEKLQLVSRLTNEQGAWTTDILCEGTPEDILEACLKQLKDQGRLHYGVPKKGEMVLDSSGLHKMKRNWRVSLALILDPPAEAESKGEESCS